MKKRATIILFWLFIWQAASMIVNNPIILVGPADTLHALFSEIANIDFWKTISNSFLKICSGFLAAFAIGIFLACAAYRFPLIGQFLEPLIVLAKSIPVASFVILALIWVGSSHLSVFISFLVGLPILYVNTLAGLQNREQQLIEMAKVFKIPIKKQLRYIYLPSLYPFLVSSCKIALGMCWKSGIAAEVIGVPSFSIGERLYMAKIYLSTADLFAWTFLIVLISACFERLFLYLIKKLPH